MNDAQSVCEACGERYEGGHICPVVLLAEARAGRPMALVLSGRAADVQTANHQAIRDLVAERARYRKALAFYADERGYASTVPHDRGRTARAALEETES